MKYLYTICGVVTLLFALMSCQRVTEPEDIFGASPEERIAATIRNYQEILTAPGNGWMGYYSSNNDRGGYLVLLNFDGQNVTIRSEAIDFMKEPEKEEKVTYRIGVKQLPELVFESHCYFQRWHDFQFSGAGLYKGGEFVFNFEKVTPDSVVLVSKKDLKDVTRLVLTPATAIDWQLGGLDEMSKRLTQVSLLSDVFITQRLGEGANAPFAELDHEKRLLTVEEAPGRAHAYRYGVTRKGIRLTEELRLNGESIRSFTYDYDHKTIVADSPSKVRLAQKSDDAPPRYFKPKFAAELLPLAPAAFVTRSWVYTQSEALQQVASLNITVREYNTFAGLEYLTGLKTFSLIGTFEAAPTIDLSHNKELRSITLMFVSNLKHLNVQGLNKLESFLMTSCTSMTEVDLSSSAQNLREVIAHLNNRKDFKLNVRGASKLTRLTSQQNGWTSLDITGCVSLRELTINSGNSYPDESDDDSQPTMSDIIGLDAKDMPNLSKVYVPTTAKCGANVRRFYHDVVSSGRAFEMMWGHALIGDPKTDPKHVYTSDTCK